jgi:hypothetical protein
VARVIFVESFERDQQPVLGSQLTHHHSETTGCDLNLTEQIASSALLRVFSSHRYQLRCCINCPPSIQSALIMFGRAIKATAPVVAGARNVTRRSAVRAVPSRDLTVIMQPIQLLSNHQLHPLTLVRCALGTSEPQQRSQHHRFALLINLPLRKSAPSSRNASGDPPPKPT